MLNTKFKRLCLVKCTKSTVGISLGKYYKRCGITPFSVCVINDYGIEYWYNEKYFREVKSNGQK